MPVQVQPTSIVITNRICLNHALMQAGFLAEGGLGANRDGGRPAAGRIRTQSSGLGPIGIGVACRPQIDQPPCVHTIHRQIAVDLIAQIRRGEADGTPTFLTVDHHAFNAVRMPQHRVSRSDTPLREQIAHIRRAPHTRELGVVAFAPRTAFRLAHTLKRILRLTVFTGHMRLGMGGDAHMPGPEIIHHIQLEHAGRRGEIGDGLHIAFAPLPHGGVTAQHQCAHAKPAGELAKEKDV